MYFLHNIEIRNQNVFSYPFAACKKIIFCTEILSCDCQNLHSFHSHEKNYKPTFLFLEKHKKEQDDILYFILFWVLNYLLVHALEQY